MGKNYLLLFSLAFFALSRLYRRLISLSISSCFICSPLLPGVFIPCCFTFLLSSSNSSVLSSCFFFLSSSAYLLRKNFSSSVSSTIFFPSLLLNEQPTRTFACFKINFSLILFRVRDGTVEQIRMLRINYINNQNYIYDQSIQPNLQHSILCPLEHMLYTLDTQS